MVNSFHRASRAECCLENYLAPVGALHIAYIGKAGCECNLAMSAKCTAKIYQES